MFVTSCIAKQRKGMLKAQDQETAKTWCNHQEMPSK